MGHVLRRLRAGPLVHPTLSSTLSFTPCPVTFFRESPQRAQRIGALLDAEEQAEFTHSSPPALGSLFRRDAQWASETLNTVSGRETHPPNASPIPSIFPRHSFLDGACESVPSYSYILPDTNPPCVISRHGKNLLLADEELASWCTAATLATRQEPLLDSFT